jgi:uncharacterized surface protein with fasciclin (FAS1) repeats
MSAPLAICIEYMKPRTKAKFMQCVALPGRQPGLRLDSRGKLTWQQELAAACELWVSGDDHLMLYRLEGMAPVTLRRGPRSLEVPCAQPVVVIDQDEVAIGARHLRIHIHGAAASIKPPAPLHPAAGEHGRPSGMVRNAVLVGAFVTAVGCGGCFEVRTQVPAAAPAASEPYLTPIMETAGTHAQLSSYVELLKRSGLADELAKAGPYTVFAPTNEALEAFLRKRNNTGGQLEMTEEWMQILRYHVIPATVGPADFAAGGEQDTLAQIPVHLAKNGEQLQVESAKILGKNIDASNGVIYVVDRILIPPSQ